MDEINNELLRILFEIIMNDNTTISDGNILTALYSLLKKEGLLGLLYKVETKAYLDKKIKTEVLYTIKKNVIDNDMRKYGELINLFENEKIRYVVLKGNYLIQNVYGEIKYRHSNDMDLLVEEKQIDKIVRILNCLGYIKGEYDAKSKKVCSLTRKEVILYEMESNQLAPYVKINKNYPAHPCTIDIHTCFEISNQAMTNKCLNEYVYSEYNGVQIRRLKDELFFLQVCLHHYKHMNSVDIMRRGSSGLRYICDVYFFYLRNFEMINLKKLVAYIKENNYEKYVYYFMYHGQRLWGENVRVQKLLNHINTEGINESINFFGLEEQTYFWYDKFDSWLLDLNTSNNILEEVITENVRNKDINI